MQELKPTCKTYSNGIKVWQLPNGEWHRADGPAYIKPNGYKSWYWQDQVHNAEGSAKTWPDGNRYWFWYDHYIGKGRCKS